MVKVDLEDFAEELTNLFEKYGVERITPLDMKAIIGYKDKMSDDFYIESLKISCRKCE